MDGPTLITQPPGYPEERPETDDMDGMLEHLADELEGKQLLEKPRVSKKVTQFYWSLILSIPYFLHVSYYQDRFITCATKRWPFGISKLKTC